ncbi:CHRD domain-containing protein [Pararhizobium sp. BT-229]|uniref:CHRD domain-containing protein n=1 Tax=Pararhizobium sp. BT-229 TaxID=2986923 RepID=UPI0021F7DEF2|nr:CHRD domain-containing protein [Pararhizobium sp. BT-229]MCV9966850.1 CHRD domain-containing protein [Pararhizobium sp. BT-229]
MQSSALNVGIGALALAGFLAVSATGFAEEMKFKADLKGSTEVPPVQTSATGTADIIYDPTSKNLTWTIEHTGLSGDVTAAHFHGPAPVGENAPPVVPIDMSALAKGSATLDEAQAKDLTEGRWYLNLHTAAKPDGEIRGQVMKAQ